MARPAMGRPGDPRRRLRAGRLDRPRPAPGRPDRGDVQRGLRGCPRRRPRPPPGGLAHARFLRGRRRGAGAAPAAVRHDALRPRPVDRRAPPVQPGPGLDRAADRGRLGESPRLLLPRAGPARARLAPGSGTASPGPPPDAADRDRLDCCFAGEPVRARGLAVRRRPLDEFIRDVADHRMAADLAAVGRRHPLLRLARPGRAARCPPRPAGGVVHPPVPRGLRGDRDLRGPRHRLVGPRGERRGGRPARRPARPERRGRVGRGVRIAAADQAQRPADRAQHRRRHRDRRRVRRPPPRLAGGGPACRCAAEPRHRRAARPHGRPRHGRGHRARHARPQPAAVGIVVRARRAGCRDGDRLEDRALPGHGLGRLRAGPFGRRRLAVDARLVGGRPRGGRPRRDGAPRPARGAGWTVTFEDEDGAILRTPGPAS